MKRLKQVTTAIINILKDEIKEVQDWQTAYVGFGRTKNKVGTVSCDKVTFAKEDKAQDEASASFSIYVLDPDNSGELEDIAFKVHNSITKNYNLDGWATDSFIKQILFGVAQGIKDAGVCVIECEVKFDLRESEAEE